MSLLAFVTGDIALHQNSTGASTEFESFWLTRNPDGSRTLRTVTRFPGDAIIRDVSHTVDSEFRPYEGYARLLRDGQLAGSVARYVRFNEVHSWLALPGAMPDTATFPRSPGLVLGFHPVAGEAWKFGGLSSVAGEVQSIRVLTVSPTWDGGGMGHGREVMLTAEWLGIDRVDTPAGDFECDHFMWHTGAIDGDIEVWSERDDRLCVRLLQHSRGMMFEMTSRVVRSPDRSGDFEYH